MKPLLLRFIIVSALASFSIPLTATAGVVDSQLQAQLENISPNQLVPVIITLNIRANTNAVHIVDKARRRVKIIQSMRDYATLKQTGLLAFLRLNRATQIKPLWIINSVAATVPARAILNLADVPLVANVYLDATLSLPRSNKSVLSAPEWNLSAIHAPDVWDLGYTGQSVVVANMDTGVDVAHPDLNIQWRGGSNSWFDPHGEYSTPTDFAGSLSGHGTQTMGLIVGRDTSGTTIGVAPDAHWIATKLFNRVGVAFESDFHQSFQWLLDPDNNPLTDDAPDVVNGSFQTSTFNVCDTRFQADIQALKTAGIAVVFGAGNSGPYVSSSSSPANNPGSFSVGAIDYLSTIATFSGRGPTPVECGSALFPSIVAPGVDVNTTDLTFAGSATYATVSGTSFAAPHVAGSMALLIDAFPKVEVTALESALQDSATDLGIPGQDNESGFGLLNVLGAYNILAASGRDPIGVDDSYVLDEDTTLTTPAPGVLGNDTDPQSNPISATLYTDVTHGSLILNADGSFLYTPESNYNGTDSFAYKATDGMHESGIVTVMLTINPVNDAPVAVDDGAYTVTSGYVLNILAASGVLANDTDIENNTLNALRMTNPSSGELTLNSDGSFSFNAAGVVAGNYAFTYIADDGLGTNNLSNLATVTINVLPNPVNTAPTANSDIFLYRPNVARIVNKAGTLGAGVLQNDSDVDLNPLTGQFVTNSLSGGGNLNFNSDGSFSFVKTTGGLSSFRYRANDGTLLSSPIWGATVYLRKDAVPKTLPDNCVYTITSNEVSEPDRCRVVGDRAIKMSLAANDVDPNQVVHVPTDGVGSTVIANSTLISFAGTGVNVNANAECGQIALGTTRTVRGTIDNNCDGTVTVTAADGNNSKTISYHYRISDDLGAQSGHRQVILTIRP
ncbi:MAG: S8 family serine peptidase [Methyloglobulus sp.]|nr:tandem-95 repeat protein [Methyloglobulus sp.]